MKFCANELFGYQEASNLFLIKFYKERQFVVYMQDYWNEIQNLFENKSSHYLYLINYMKWRQWLIDSTEESYWLIHHRKTSKCTTLSMFYCLFYLLIVKMCRITRELFRTSTIQTYETLHFSLTKFDVYWITSSHTDDVVFSLLLSCSVLFCHFVIIWCARLTCDWFAYFLRTFIIDSYCDKLWSIFAKLLIIFSWEKMTLPVVRCLRFTCDHFEKCKSLRGKDKVKQPKWQHKLLFILLLIIQNFCQSHFDGNVLDLGQNEQISKSHLAIYIFTFTTFVLYSCVVYLALLSFSVVSICVFV